VDGSCTSSSNSCNVATAPENLEDHVVMVHTPAVPIAPESDNQEQCMLVPSRALVFETTCQVSRLDDGPTPVLKSEPALIHSLPTHVSPQYSQTLFANCGLI
jgi:hypothetical protein